MTSDGAPTISMQPLIFVVGEKPFVLWHPATDAEVGDSSTGCDLSTSSISPDYLARCSTRLKLLQWQRCYG